VLPGLPAALASTNRDATREVAVRRKREAESHTPAKQDQFVEPRTIFRAIEDDLLKTLDSLSVLVQRTSRPGIRKRDVLKALPKILDLTQRAAKLATLAYPNDRPLSSQAAVRLAALWLETNPPEAEVEKILRMAGRRRRGRPATLRGVGLRALELRAVDSERWSWRALAEHLCTCGASCHEFKCQENIRREVKLLEKMLKSLGVKLPA
jgi:hypothetical protein